MASWDWRLEPPDDDGPDDEGAEPDVEPDFGDLDGDRYACAAEGAWLAGRDWSASQ